jgi:two-component system, chemotaxis family, response regulator Rcp1
MMTPGTRVQPVEILLVEDNPVDVTIISDALNAGQVRSNVHVAENGEEAMEFLHKRGKYSSVPTPEIIILDLNLPRKDGREILAEVKANPSLRRIPVIVLTVSEDEQDIWRSYDLQANCFITKPVDTEQFTKALERLGDFWFSVVRLPVPAKS